MNEASQKLLDYLRHSSGHELKVVREWLKDGAEVNAKDEEGNTPLSLELLWNENPSEILEFLCKKGADLHQRNNRQQTPLMLAVLRPAFDEFASKLIKESVDTRAVDAEGNTVAHYAYGNKKALGLLIKDGVSIYQGNSNNQTLLHVPLGVYKTGWCGEKEYGGIDTATLKWLLKQGLDPNACDVDGYTSLHAVTRINPHDPKKAANILIEFGADPLVLDAANTPLSVHFLKEGNLELAKWFAEKGTTPYDAIIACDLSKVEQVFNPRDSVSPVRGGLTPLHVAALANSSPEIVYRLIKTSSNLDQTDELGKTALVLGPVHSSRFVFTSWNLGVRHGSTDVERQTMVADCASASW